MSLLKTISHSVPPIAMATLVPLLSIGCASTLPGKFHDGFLPDGSLVLGDVAFILTREEMKTGVDVGQSKIPPIYQELLSSGIKEQDLTEGRVAVVVYQMYWHNRSRLHSWFDWAIVANGVTARKGNLVALQVSRPHTVLQRILYANREDGGCQIMTGDRGSFGVLDAVNPLGGPGTANLFCPKLEQQGWQKTPVGPYKGGFLMTKQPEQPLSQ